MRGVELEKNLAEVRKKWKCLKEKEIKILVALKRAETDFDREVLRRALHSVKEELLQVQYEMARLVRLSKMQVATV